MFVILPFLLKNSDRNFWLMHVGRANIRPVYTDRATLNVDSNWAVLVAAYFEWYCCIYVLIRSEEKDPDRYKLGCQCGLPGKEKGAFWGRVEGEQEE